MLTHLYLSALDGQTLFQPREASSKLSFRPDDFQKEQVLDTIEVIKRNVRCQSCEHDTCSL